MPMKINNNSKSIDRVLIVKTKLPARARTLQSQSLNLHGFFKHILVEKEIKCVAIESHLFNNYIATVN